MRRLLICIEIYAQTMDSRTNVFDNLKSPWKTMEYLVSQILRGAYRVKKNEKNGKDEKNGKNEKNGKD